MTLIPILIKDLKAHHDIIKTLELKHKFAARIASLNQYNDGHSIQSIHFIQNLMLNSNLKSDIQKNI
jgi:hypothetical protein